MLGKPLFLSTLLLLTGAIGFGLTVLDTHPQRLSVEFVHDEYDNFLVEEVIHKKFKPITNRNSLGINFDIVWYKITLEASPQETQLYLHSKLAYLSQLIEIYEWVEGTFVSSRYDLLNSHIANKLSGSTLVYPLNVMPDTKKIIFIKNKALIHQIIDFDVYDKQQSIQSLINKNYFSNFIISCLFSLALYNIMIFFYNKRKEFLIYGLYLVNASIGLAYLYGSIFHNLNIYGQQVYWLNITAILVSVFLAMYVQAVFDTYKTSRKIHYIFKLVIAISIIDLMIAIFIDLPIAIDIIGLVFLSSLSAICYLVVYYSERKHPLIKVFTIAYLFYVVGIIIILSTLMGFIPYNSFTFHASGIGILIEAVLFSYLLNFRMILLERKVSKLVGIQKNLAFIANHDHLTNILNRRAFINQAEAAISLAKRHNEPLSLIMIDLDLFKKVNDDYGHHTGDVVLSTFAETVKNVIRNEDVFGRVGGEEFSVILPKLTKEQAFFVAEKLRKAVSGKGILAENNRINQTISIGLSVLNESDRSLSDLQKRADKALYEAKEKGRNQVVFG